MTQNLVGVDVSKDALERALGDAGIDAVKINPLQARRFAEATGASAKGLTLAILRRQNAARRRQIEAQIKAVAAGLVVLREAEPASPPSCVAANLLVARMHLKTVDPRMAIRPALQADAGGG